MHGFVVTYPGGAALVETGVGGPPDLIRDWEVVNVTAADALAGLRLVPGDIDLVINTCVVRGYLAARRGLAHSRAGTAGKAGADLVDLGEAETVYRVSASS